MFIYLGISNEIYRVECFVTKFTQKLYEILTYLAGMPEWMEAFRMVFVILLMKAHHMIGSYD